MRSIPILVTILLVVTVIIAGCGGSPETAAPKSTTNTAANPTTTTTTQATTTTEKPATTTVTTTTSTPPPATTTTTVAPKPAFTATSPVAQFTADDIAFLGVNFSGTPIQIADAIKKWQEDTWTYAAATMDYPDVSDPIRWNYFLPGIFNSRDIVHEQVKNGKIYGVCFSYATVYASIANYYGLETRVVNSISKPSDTNPNIGITTGMSPDEYNRLKLKLDKNGLRYAFDAVRLVAEETPEHYWTEVKIDGKWYIEDATQKSTGGVTQVSYVEKDNYIVTDFLARDKSAQLDEYQAKLDRGERLPENGGDQFIPKPTKPADYVGVTDDLGQTGRAASIDDVMQGFALVPYFNNVADAFTFCHVPAVQSMIMQEQLLKTAYESQSGKKMYAAALLILQDKSGQELADSYYKLTGEQLDLVVYQQLLNSVK